MRRRLDQYFTPEFATKVLLHYNPHIGGQILECCSGDDAITKVLFRHCAATGLPYEIRTNDIDPGMPSSEHWDAADGSKQNWGRPNWIVSNPPFNGAEAIVPAAFSSASDGIAMLLRISFLEPCKGRSRFMAEFPPTQLVVLPRISFTGDGKTDNVTCAWFIWDFCLKPALPLIVVSREFAMQL